MVSFFDKHIYSTPLFLFRAKIVIAFLLLIFLCPITAYLQPAQYFENPIIKDARVGYINDAIIDKNGFLWIAGSNGLVRYDGSQFKSFNHNPKDSLSLMCNDLTDLFYNEQTNQLFITSWNTAKGGLSILDLESEQFKNVRFDSSNSSGLEGQGLYWTHQDKFGNYWISIKNKGLINYFPENDSIVQFPYQLLLGEENKDKGRINTFMSYSIDSFNDSLLWLGALDGALLKFNFLNQRYTRYPLHFPKGSSLRSIFHHSDQKVYIGTWADGLYSFDPQTAQFKKHDFKGISYDPKPLIDAIFDIKAASLNSLFITTEAGLIEYDVKQEKVIQFKKNDYIQKTFYGIYETDKKNRALFWQNNNFYIFDPLRQQNQFYSYGIKSPDFDFLVRRILEDETNGKLWIAAQFSEGLYRLDLKTKEWEVFPPPKSYFDDRPSFLAWDVVKTKAGEILVLDSESGIYKVLEKEKRLVAWDFQPDNTKYRRMIEDSRGNIWVGTQHDGVFKINPTSKKTRHFKKEFSHPELSGVGAATDLKEDRNGNIWIRSKGLKVYDPRRDTVYLFPYFFSNQKAVYHIASLGIDGDGNVIAGSHEGAIGITDADHPEKGIVEYFDKSKGLKMQKPLSFLLDEKKNIWLLNQGLEKINADRSGTYVYKSSSFSTTESTTFTELSDGAFAIGDRHGINIINPDSLKINQDLFHPYIHSFKVFDKEINLESSLFQTTDVYLKAGENFFSLEFSAIKPTFFGGAKFQYQLDGVDPDWVDPKNRRYVAYTNVESGTYDFKLKVRNNENVWNEISSVMRIHIASYWYKTWLSLIHI